MFWKEVGILQICIAVSGKEWQLVCSKPLVSHHLAASGEWILLPRVCETH